ncbi:UNVERIFIED_CONTAM: hypothetical protein Sindi_2677400, partial [Sesamum indicum]
PGATTVAALQLVSTGERERALLPFTQTVQEWQSTPIGVLLPLTDLIVPIRLSSLRTDPQSLRN